MNEEEKKEAKQESERGKSGGRETDEREGEMKGGRERDGEG